MTNTEESDKLTGDFIVKKIKMLFMDDRTKRIMAALNKYQDKYDVTIVTNVKECLRYLCQQQWDILSLDHDLNGDDFQDPDDINSGMEVIRYLTKTAWTDRYKKPEVWVHSSNLFAAELMLVMFQNLNFKAYYRKFEYDEDRTKPAAKHEPVEDAWAGYTIRKCLSCGNSRSTDINGQCHECYKREMVQCAS